MNRRLLLAIAAEAACGVPSPLSVANLALWLDGSDASTITVATGASQWNDKSTNGNNATQGTGANQPTVSAAAQNGLQALSFNGTSMRMDIANAASLQIGTGVTFFMVGSLVNWTDAAARSFLDKGPHASGENYLFSKDGTSNAMQFVYNDGSFRLITDSTNFHGTANQFYCLCFRVDKTGHTCEFRVGGISKSTVTDVNNMNYSGASVTGARVGADNSGGSFFNGKMGEIVLYNRTLTNGEVSSVETYLRNKWAV